MIHTILNEATGEILTVTEEQLRTMLLHAPNSGMGDFLRNRVLVGNHLELSSSDFATFCYLATRTWLGVKGESQHPA